MTEHPFPVSPRFQNLAGQIFNRLRVVSYAGKVRGRPAWNCLCHCGTMTVVLSCDLKRENVKTCGCLRVEQCAKRTRHGHARHGARSKEWNTGRSMLSRCDNKKAAHYDEYGGRGIKVCDRWRWSFETFLADMGAAPSLAHTIDRFPDQNGGYEPDNCRWATVTEQMRNRRNNHKLLHNGISLTISEWAEKFGISKVTILARIKRGWTAERALTEPIHARHRRRGE